ncbi:MAG: hypothetical protein KAR06_04480 [Deltaproteobacteria bacterium]|nr:hypothetical protein [Deltaproteobacteria bacterium]
MKRERAISEARRAAKGCDDNVTVFVDLLSDDFEGGRYGYARADRVDSICPKHEVVVTMEAGTGLDIWPLDKYQKIVAESYEGGEFNHDEVMEDVGDGLFKFLITEISDEEMCMSYSEAVNRLSTIIQQVKEVRAAMEIAESKEISKKGMGA